VKREKFEALSSPSMRAGGGGGHKPVVTHNGKPRASAPARAAASASPADPTP
jgi:NosR/NirI family transcriptional regulator, nitrous oxide reductase regulator